MLSWFQIPISKLRRSLFSNQLAHPTGAYSGSLRMKRQGELHSSSFENVKETDISNMKANFKSNFSKTPKLQEREMEDGSFLQHNQFHFENWMTSTIPHTMLSIKLPRLPLNSHQYLLITFPLAWLFAFCTLWASCTQLSNIRRNNFFSDPSAMCMALLFNTLASVIKI